MDLLLAPSNAFWSESAVGIKKLFGTELDKSFTWDNDDGPVLSIVVIESEGDVACGEAELPPRKPLENEDVFIKGNVWFCCWFDVDNWVVSDIRRWWNGAHAEVWDAKESVFSKVLPHLQRKGIFLRGFFF